MRLRRPSSAPRAFAFLALALSAPLAAEVPGIDALAAAGKRPRVLAAEPDAVTGARIAHVEERFGVPTFVWAAPQGAPARAPLALPATRERIASEARRAVAAHAPLWGLAPRDLDGVLLTRVHDTGRGPLVATFRAAADGVEVFREEISVAMARDLSPIAISGYLAPVASLPRAGAFRLDRREAVATAFRDVTGAALDPGDLVSVGTQGAYERLAYRPGQATGFFVEDVRVKRVLFHLPGALVPAFYVDMRVGRSDAKDADYVAWVVSAEDGTVLFRHDLTAADAYSYRVWADPSGLRAPYDSPGGNASSPHPTGTPNGFQPSTVPPVLVTLQNGPIATNDPWLPPGATETSGNNADAYADLGAPDGFSQGDFRATTTSAGSFDRVYDTSAQPTASRDQQMAAITQLFYDVNYFHDWYYGSGFDEAAGNAQASNYGRGGVEGDALHAEAQDYGGRNNANMSTPPDGGHPRMQMYLWDANAAYSVTANAPASVAGVYSSGTAEFGPHAFRVTADAALVENAGGLHDGCSPATNASALAGKIAMIDRGICPFVDKTKNAQAAGAVGVLILNNQPGALSMAGEDASITIPSMIVWQADGAKLKAASGVNLTLARDAGIDRDGSVDNQIVGHEWGHYISNRLVHDAVGLSTNMSNGLGEGWADFHALLLTVKPEDASLAGNAGFSGAYAPGAFVMGGWGDKGLANQGFYFGVRRVPYSTDFTKDPLTFQHISEGVPLPTTAPLAFGASGVGNSEVHNTGEIWCTMLWESYVALLRDTSRLSFDQARDRMKDILVAAYKLTPVNPTLLEARDAVLAAALAFDRADYVLIAGAFARRGAGTRAVAPDRYDAGNTGVVESYLAAGDVALVAASLDDSAVSCDVDGVLDRGETGVVRLVLKNVGTGSLANATVTFSTAAQGASIAGTPVVAVPPIAPLQTATVSVPVALSSAVSGGVFALDLTATVSDASFAAPRVLPLSFRANADDVAGQSATDDVESARPAFTASGTWQRVAVSPLDHRWQGVDDGSYGESILTSPSFDVAGAFALSFRHRFYFPTYPSSTGGEYFVDGGVVEASTDGGATWKDVGDMGVTVPYSGRLWQAPQNPLGTRRAFAGTSGGWPALSTVTLDFGSALAGKSVQLRFRIGMANFEGSSGWEIDDIAFSGASNKPFAAIVPHRAQCVPATGIAFDATPRSAAFGERVTLTATVAGATSGGVVFRDGPETLATATVDASGRATFSTTSLAAGSHVLSAFRPVTGAAAPATSSPVTVVVARASGATTSSTFVPIVLDVDTGTAHFVSEIALTNPGTLPVTATMKYTASMGSGSGTATAVLAPGEQRILPDALTALRLQGLSIPGASAGAQGGTVAISFDNATPGALPAATVRTFALTAAPQPVGAAGLAYGGSEAVTTSATLYGLRSSDADRSNVAVFNTGAVPVTLKVTVFSGAADGRSVVVDGARALDPGAWFQYTRILDNAGFGTAGITNGWVVVERASADGSFGTYGVVNDSKTNDGSFVTPVAGTISGTTLTLPVLVETSAFRSELVLANRGTAAATLALTYRESIGPSVGSPGPIVGGVNVTLAPGEQRIIPEAIDWLRRNGAPIGGQNASSYAGALRVSVSGVPASSVFVGARTASQSLAGGQFGLFTPPVYAGQEASSSAALYGLRVDANDRSNVAVLNAGSDGDVTLSIQAYDGSAGGAARGTPTVVTLAPGQWAQYGGILSGAGVSNGWVVVTRTSGSAPWIAYGVINDGGSPGQRTGDGAYVPMTR